MESVMNFLADNYIWFFVAAGVLCFALLGFIIESKKKQKNEFKGESIEESPDVNSGLESPVLSTPVEPINTEPTSENNINNQQNNVMENVSLDDTMEIQDIPLATDPVIQEPTPSTIEYYSAPISMPNDAPKPMPVENLQDIPTNNVSMGSVVPDNGNISATIFEPTEYTKETVVNDVNNSNNVNNVTYSEQHVEESNENTQPSNIFDDLK